MLLPPLCTQDQYVEYATAAGLQVFAPPKDISQDVSKTWSALTLILSFSLFLSRRC